jgi:biopolymer transport protein ExbD
MSMSVGSPDEEEGAAISEINTTPLVDIMTKPENITISIDKKGQIFWNAGVMPDKQVFFQRIVAEARKVPQPEFHIRGDREARWEGVGRVIFNLQRGGIVKVGFITEPDRGSIRVTR